MKQAYSYIRFSSELQTKGDSLRRQTQLAEDYALKHNLLLDTHSYRDLGVSAFKGRNKAEGKLGTFLEALHKGVIPAGSYLLIENFDRLSREEVLSALALFMQILSYGIRLVTLQDGQVYDKDRVAADNGTSLIIAIIQIGRAHNESATKSKRVKEAWDAKRAAGQIVTGKGPSWLKLNRVKQKWEFVPEKVKVVQRVFQLAHDGHGQNKIAHILNAEGVVTMQGAEWSQSAARNLLMNPAVIGTFTQKMGGNAVIEDYFPPIVDKAFFYKVQDGIKNRRGAGGQKKEGQITNLFSAMSFCLYCGARMRYIKTRAPYGYLHCTVAYSGQSACQAVRFPYHTAEAAILDRLVRAQGSELRNEYKDNDDTQRQVLRAEVVELGKRQEAALSIALKVGKNVDVVAKELDQIQARIEKLQEQLRDLDHVPVSGDEVNESVGLISHHASLVERGDSDDLNALRLSMQTALRRLITKVEFAPMWSSSDAGKAYGKKHKNFFEGKLLSQKTGARYPISERPEYLIQLTFTKSTRLLDATSLVSPTTITKHKMTQMRRQRGAAGT